MRILNSTNKLKSTTATGMIGKLVQIKFNLGTSFRNLTKVFSNLIYNCVISEFVLKMIFNQIVLFEIELN